MPRKLLAIIAAVGILVTLVAAPVGADTPLVGEMDLQFNLGLGDPTAPCPEFSWAGTIDFEGDTFGLAFIPTGRVDGGRGFLFQEFWVVYESFVPEFTDGVLTACMGDVAMWGYDEGVANAPHLTATAEGNVVWVDAGGSFPTDLVGNRMVFRGMSDANFLEFNGTFAIAP